MTKTIFIAIFIFALFTLCLAFYHYKETQKEITNVCNEYNFKIRNEGLNYQVVNGIPRAKIGNKLYTQEDLYYLCEDGGH